MTNRQVIENFLNARREAIVSRIKQASGRTARRIHTVVDTDGTGGSLYGPAYIQALEDGRGPTKVSTPSNPTLREAIEEWLQYAGIPTPPGKTRRDLAYAIAASIHAKGTKLYQQGGNSGVISDAINEKAFSNLLSQLAAIEQITVSTQILNQFKINLKQSAA